MVCKRKDADARSSQPCQFFRMGVCTQGVLCPLSHGVEIQQRGVDTESACDSADEWSVVSESTASQVEGKKNAKKGEGETPMQRNSKEVLTLTSRSIAGLMGMRSRSQRLVE